MKKIFFTLFVALVCTAQGFARDFEVDGIYYYLLGGDSVEVTSSRYGHNPGSVTIPETVVYNSTTYRVTTIGNSAFSGCSGLTEVTIGESVTTIGDDAFQNCSSLTSITIPNSVTAIGWGTFSGCSSLQYNTYDNANYLGNSENPYHALISATSTSIASCDIHKDTKIIAGGAFHYCSSLTSITIPNSVTTIGSQAFHYCSSLTEVTIGNSVTTIGTSAFGDCSSLTAITIPNSVTTISFFAFSGCSSLTQTNYTGDLASWCKIQFDTEGANPVRYSHNLYINGTSITKADIPEGVTSISQCAFYGLTTLTEVTIPNSVTTIGENAFGDCSSLTTVTIGTGLDSLAAYAFYGCNKLTKFVCHSTKAIEAMEKERYKSDESIGGYAQQGAFLLCNKQLDTIVAPAQFFDLKEPAWSNLTKSAKYIQIIGQELTPDAFGVINRSFDKLQTLDIAATSNTEIANNAFKGCYKLETLLLPTQLEHIGYMAVADCKNLQAIDIPATVTDIDDSAFENCRSIETLTFGGQQPANAPAFASEETRMKGVSTSSALQRIGNWAFYNCHELQHLEIPEGVTEIGAAAFYGCTYLEDLTLPASVQSIGDNCFALCSKLNKITCLATVPPTIEAKTFYDVNRAIPLYVPEASINDYANDTYWGEFINPQAAETPDGVDNILQNSTPTTRKVLHNGTIYILRNGEKYTIDGRKVE